MEGKIKGIELLDLLKFFCNTQKSGRISVFKGKKNGFIDIEKGQVISAFFDNNESFLALKEIFTTDGGFLIFSKLPQNVTKNIDLSFEELLLNLTREIDEIKLKNKFDEKLSAIIKNFPKIKSISAFSKDGSLLSSFPADFFDTEKISTLICLINKKYQRIKEFFVDGGIDNIIFYKCYPGLYLLLITQNDLNYAIWEKFQIEIENLLSEFKEEK